MKKATKRAKKIKKRAENNATSRPSQTIFGQIETDCDLQAVSLNRYGDFLLTGIFPVYEYTVQIACEYRANTVRNYKLMVVIRFVCLSVCLFQSRPAAFFGKINGKWRCPKLRLLVESARQLLTKRSVLLSLFIVNFLGSIYGFYWYKNQLISVGSWLNIFVPDSPTASAAFTLVLALYLLKKRSPLAEAFAIVTLFKYGVWAIAMIVCGAAENARLFGGSMFAYFHWTDWMLMVSHGGMALEGLLFARFYTYRWQHLAIVGAWTLLNDYMDYIVGLHPWLPVSLDPYVGTIGWYTALLSIISLAIAAYVVHRSQRQGPIEL